MSHPPIDQQSEFIAAATGFAVCVALVATFLGVPLIHRHTIGIVMEIVADAYGPNLDHAVWLGWYAVLYPTVYFAARASLATALVGGAVAFAARFII